MITFKAKDKAGEVFNSALSPFSFPAGEAHIKREDRRELEQTEIAIIQPTAESLHTDLFQLAAWSDYISRTDPNLMDEAKRIKTAVILPYLPAARADRGAPYGAQIYAKFIADLFLDKLVCFDPHSPVFLDEYNYFTGKEVEAIAVYSDEILGKVRQGLPTYSGVIAPDKGAVDRTQKVADALGVPMYRAGKKRDEATGKLSGFHMEDPLPGNGKYLLVDDICDGGGTFLGLAAMTGLPKSQLDLFVSHGVFSKDATHTLPKAFGRIYTTNSYAPNADLEKWTKYSSHEPVFKRIPIIGHLLGKV